MSNQSLSDCLAIVLTTESDVKAANDLALELLKLRVAACVSISEIKSNFWWEGKIHSNNEAQILIKTTKDDLQNLMEALNKLHSYQTPEIISWNASSSKDYISCVRDIVSNAS